MPSSDIAECRGEGEEANENLLLGGGCGRLIEQLRERTEKGWQKHNLDRAAH